MPSWVTTHHFCCQEFKKTDSSGSVVAFCGCTESIEVNELRGGVITSFLNEDAAGLRVNLVAGRLNRTVGPNDDRAGGAESRDVSKGLKTSFSAV